MRWPVTWHLGATAYRYLDEVIAVLASEAPELREALERAGDEGLSPVIPDGKIIPRDRCKEPPVSVKGQVIDLHHMNFVEITSLANPGLT